MAYKHSRITGNRHQVGLALGKLARPLMTIYLEQSPTWEALRPWRGHPYLEQLAQQTKQWFPSLWEELEGMAEGLGLPVTDVFMWNCRGDLLHKTTDGCTTVALAGKDGSRWIAHNEDGDPFLYGRVRLVEVKPDDAPGYLSFYYPGSLPGHTFAANKAGLVQTINNVRTKQRHAGVPRMVLARAVLDCETLDQALDVLRDTPSAGGFHHMLASASDTRMFSIELVPGHCSVLDIPQRYGHANHLIHRDSENQAQVITDSSRERQNRIDGIVDAWSADTVGQDLVTALLDTQGDLPILRCDKNDPDEENTLATALFEMRDGQVTLRVYDRQDSPAFEQTL